MRIDFQNSGTTQAPVTPAQTKMRNARTQKRPVLRMVVLLALAGGAAWGVWWFMRVGTVYTYGVVTARVTPYYAPFEGVIGGLALERGQHVAQGAALFTLTSTQPVNIRAAQDSLITEIDRQKGVAEEARQNEIAQAQKEVERVRAAYEEESAKRQAAIEIAKAELAKTKDIYASRQRQAERAKDLFGLGAAITSDVDAARDAAQVARRTLDQAGVALKAAEQIGVASPAELAKAELALKQLQEGKPQDTSALERGRVELAVAQTRPAPVAVTSLFDGIVMDVGAVNGAQVESGRVVATIVARDSIWVEAYVPAGQARRVRTGGEALIYLPGEPGPVKGTIADDSGAAIRIPEILRDKLPSTMTGIYTRVNFTPPVGVPVVPGSRVRVVIEK
jgi:multidrug resistance efflux pump